MSDWAYDLYQEQSLAAVLVQAVAQEIAGRTWGTLYGIPVIIDEEIPLDGLGFVVTKEALMMPAGQDNHS